MRVIRSLFFAGLALAAMAMSVATPAIALTPADPGIHVSTKARFASPAIYHVQTDEVALICEAPAGMLGHARERQPAMTRAVTGTLPAGTSPSSIVFRMRC